MNKVIEIFESVLGEAWRNGDTHEGPSRYYPLKEAEALYARIAPLREFPRKEFEALLLRFNGMDIASAWLDDCERIWEGTGERRQVKRREGGCRRSLLNRRHHPETGTPLYDRWDDGRRIGKDRRHE